MDCKKGNNKSNDNYKNRKLRLDIDGILMEGDSTSLRRLFAFLNVNECYRDFSPIIRGGGRLGGT